MMKSGCTASVLFYVMSYSLSKGVDLFSSPHINSRGLIYLPLSYTRYRIFSEKLGNFFVTKLASSRFFDSLLL